MQLAGVQRRQQRVEKLFGEFFLLGVRLRVHGLAERFRDEFVERLLHLLRQHDVQHLVGLGVLLHQAAEQVLLFAQLGDGGL